jgi:Bax protein
MSVEQRLSLENLAQKYGVNFGDWAELRRRVREVPVSLALAQGAEESGWGTSRFAHQGNAVFGQRTFTRGRGIVPKEREAGEKFEVLRFSALLTSVRAYVWNLNTHFAYADFRTARAQGHARGGKPDSMSLIATLKRYSERGEAYIETIRAIIRVNRLRQFDAARLTGADKNV